MQPVLETIAVDSPDREIRSFLTLKRPDMELIPGIEIGKRLGSPPLEPSPGALESPPLEKFLLTPLLKTN